MSQASAAHNAAVAASAESIVGRGDRQMTSSRCLEQEANRNFTAGEEHGAEYDN